MTAPKERSRLETARKDASLSRREVAEELGITVRHLFRIERGETKPRRAYLKVLADLYDDEGISTEYL